VAVAGLAYAIARARECKLNEIKQLIKVLALLEKLIEILGRFVARNVLI